MSERTDELLAELVTDIMAERDEARAEAERLRDEVAELRGSWTDIDKGAMGAGDDAIYQRATRSGCETTRHGCKTMGDWEGHVILRSQLPPWMSYTDFGLRYGDRLGAAWRRACEADPLGADDDEA